MPYSLEIQRYGSQYGYKTANLINLQTLLEGLRLEGGVRAGVPEFQGFSDQEIKKVMMVLVPTWEQMWEEFVSQFKADGGLKSAALEILLKLQQEIEAGFSNDVFKMGLLKLDSRLTATILMVRSTGHEDNEEIANPGGNASYLSQNDTGAISKAIGRVVSSYFDKKSLCQILLAARDITEIPPTPVLLQNLIGEGVSESTGMITSGVSYSGNGQTKIDAAPGHGELVVNSKGPVDSFYITSDGMVFAERRAKPFRMKPAIDKVTSAMSLEMTSNGINNEYEFSIDETTVRAIHQLAQAIEKSYCMKMDTEFVYDYQSKTIYVVQTRPLPEGKRKGAMPSALDPQLIGTVSAKQLGSTITIEINSALVIKDANSIFVCHSIKQALDYHLHDPNGKTIKAVIIQKVAPSTSHEAGEFNSLGIPVLQVKNIEAVEAMIKTVVEQNLVIDPQRKSIFQLPQDLSIEGAIVLKEGLFRSTLSSDVSLFNGQFRGNPYEIGFVELSPNGRQVGMWLAGTKSTNPVKAKANLEILFSYIYSNVKKAKAFTTFTLREGGSLVTALDQLQNLNADNIKENRENLARIMNTVLQYRKQDIGISTTLFKQIMITGAAGFALIDKVGRSPDPSSHMLYSEYLNVYEKFYGMIYSHNSEATLNNCLRNDLAQRKLENRATVLLEGKPTLSSEYKEVLKKGIALSHYCLNEPTKAKWESFCLEACKLSEFTNVVGKVVHMNIQELWMSTSFTKSKGSAEEILQNLVKELEVVEAQEDKLKEIDTRILSLKSSIPLWKDPAKFNRLYVEFHTDVGYIKQNINFDTNEPATLQIIKAKQMIGLVDAVDLTLKSLSTSGQYEDKVKQAENFQCVLKDFYDVLEAWSEGVGDVRARNAILDKAKSFFDQKYVVKVDDLSISGLFNVASANINALILGDNGWNRILSACRTLQDLFTLLHQSLINVISRLISNLNRLIKSELPQEITTIIDTLESFQFNIEDRIVTGELLYISAKNKRITLEYNLSLRNHSALYYLVYDSATKVVTLEFLVFGHNGGGRWTFAEALLNTDLEQNLGIKFVEKANYNHNKSYMAFKVDVTGLLPQTLNAMLDSINNNCIQISFSSVLTLRSKQILQQLLQDNYELLTSDGARKAYVEGASMLELKDLDPSKINSLISDDALKVYWYGVKVSHLKDQEVDTINALTSSDAAKVYTLGITVSYLKYLGLDKIIVWISNVAYRAYELRINIEGFRGLDLEQIKFEILRRVFQAYNGGEEIEDLKSYDTDTINALLSDNAIKTYEEGAKVSDFKGFVPGAIAILTSYNARATYKLGKKILDFKDLALDRLTALTSYSARVMYELGNEVSDLKDIDLDALDVLASWDAKETFRVGVKVSDLKGLEADKITALVSYDARHMYKTGKITVQYLRDLDINTVKLLTSFNFYRIFTGWDQKEHKFAQLSAPDTILIKKLAEDIKKALFNEGAEDNYGDVESINLNLSEVVNRIKRDYPDCKVQHLYMKRAELIKHLQQRKITTIQAIEAALQTGDFWMYRIIPDQVMAEATVFIDKCIADAVVHLVSAKSVVNGRSSRILAGTSVPTPVPTSSSVLTLAPTVLPTATLIPIASEVVAKLQESQSDLIVFAGRYQYPLEYGVIDDGYATMHSTSLLQMRLQSTNSASSETYIDWKGFYLMVELHNTNVLFKLLNLLISSIKLLHEPNVQNLKTASFQAFNILNSAVLSSVIVGIHQFKQGEYLNAFTTIVAPILLPIGFYYSPLLGLGMSILTAAYEAKSLVANLDDLDKLSNGKTVGAVMRSLTAFKDLAAVLSKQVPLQFMYNFAKLSENYEEQIKSLNRLLKSVQLELPLEEASNLMAIKHISIDGYKNCVQVPQPWVENYYYCSNTDSELIDQVVIGDVNKVIGHVYT